MAPKVLYRDRQLLVVDKPAWTLVHRGIGRDGPVLVDQVRELLGEAVVYPVHRLDRQTSGPVVFARNKEVAATMQQKFVAGEVHKTYLALVRGVPADGGIVDSPVPRVEGGERVAARTEYSLVSSAETVPRTLSLVRVHPVTGRFHQIRRHMKHINHPVIGDANYGKGILNRAIRERYGLARMALHAASIVFAHPVTGVELSICAGLPDDLQGPLDRMGFAL